MTPGHGAARSGMLADCGASRRTTASLARVSGAEERISSGNRVHDRRFCPVRGLAGHPSHRAARRGEPSDRHRHRHPAQRPRVGRDHQHHAWPLAARMVESAASAALRDASPGREVQGTAGRAGQADARTRDPRTVLNCLAVQDNLHQVLPGNREGSGNIQPGKTRWTALQAARIDDPLCTRKLSFPFLGRRWPLLPIASLKSCSPPVISAATVAVIPRGACGLRPSALMGWVPAEFSLVMRYPSAPYLRGRDLGGSAAINAMTHGWGLLVAEELAGRRGLRQSPERKNVLVRAQLADGTAPVQIPAGHARPDEGGRPLANRYASQPPSSHRGVRARVPGGTAGGRGPGRAPGPGPPPPAWRILASR
jgi:hypothetical protein